MSYKYFCQFWWVQRFWIRIYQFKIKVTRLIGALQGLRQCLQLNDKKKMMINASYFTLKALFILKILYLNFCLAFSVMFKNGLIKKIRLILKFMTSQPGKQTIAILPSISRIKDNQTLKFGHVIVYKLRNIFYEKSLTNYGGKAIPRPFSKKAKSIISLD